MSDANPMRIAIVGEALIDFTSTGGGGLGFDGHEGGAPANCAVAAARLGQPTGFISQLSTDLFGERLFSHLQRNGVDMRFVLRSSAPSTLAFVERTPHSNAYAFYVHGSADTLWAPAELPALPDACRFLQFGSIALLHEPAASRIMDLVRAERGRRVLLFDPNVRPSLIDDLDAYRARFWSDWVGCCDLLKLSDEDAELIAPRHDVAELAARLLACGPRAVVVTRGAQGASLFRAAAARIDMPAPPCEVVDTIGAGDTFSAALSVALLEHGVEQPAQLDALTGQDWREVLRFAAFAAALNCTRTGADPPRRAALDAALTLS